jgi:hypothetical protein
VRTFLAFLVALAVGSAVQAALILVTGSTYDTALFSTPNSVLGSSTLTVNGAP